MDWCSHAIKQIGLTNTYNQINYWSVIDTNLFQRYELFKNKPTEKLFADF